MAERLWLAGHEMAFDHVEISSLKLRKKNTNSSRFPLSPNL